MKYLKLFEAFSAEPIEEDVELSKGQKAAVSSGKNLLTLGQAAIAYVFALDSELSGGSNKGLAKTLREKYGNTNNLLTEIFGAGWKQKDFTTWKKEVLYPQIDIKDGSMTRAVGKMSNMINGIEESTPSDALYKLILDYFKTIEAMSREELVDFISDYYADPSKEEYQAGYVVPVKK